MQGIPLTSHARHWVLMGFFILMGYYWPESVVTYIQNLPRFVYNNTDILTQILTHCSVLIIFLKTKQNKK